MPKVPGNKVSIQSVPNVSDEWALMAIATMDQMGRFKDPTLRFHNKEMLNTHSEEMLKIHNQEMKPMEPVNER